jgi:nucleotide-binding universal stress UspA family protein
MRSVTEQTIATATRREPILIRYGDAVIVIGSRPAKGMKKAFDAGVSPQVAEHAGRPALIVPPPR